MPLPVCVAFTDCSILMTGGSPCSRVRASTVPAFCVSAVASTSPRMPVLEMGSAWLSVSRLSGGRAVGSAAIALVVADLVVAALEAPASPDPSWLPQAASRVMIERLKASRLKVAFMLPVYPSGTGRSLTLAPSCDYFVYER